MVEYNKKTYEPMPEDREHWPTAEVLPEDTQAGSGVDTSDYGETLAFLRCFDTMFLVDDSAHMEPYWGDVRALLERITPICAKYDPDGIDIYFLNHQPKTLMSLAGMSSVRKSGYRRIGGFHDDSGSAKADKHTVAGIFNKVKPSGKCNLGARLTKLLGWYCDKLKADEEGAALNLIVITAGVFDDNVEAPLTNVARMLDELQVPEHQVGVQLFQIGRPNATVQRTFEYLDDELHKATNTRDIVDTTTWTGQPGSLSTDDLLKVVLGAVVKKLDERKSALDLDASAPSRRMDRD